MTIKPDADGNLYTMNDCLRCDNVGPHFASYMSNGRPMFQCALCMSPIGDASPIPASWLPAGE